MDTVQLLFGFQGRINRARDWIAVGIKRLYDLDKTSLGFSIWGLVELGFLRGTSGANQYDADPLGA